MTSTHKVAGSTPAGDATPCDDHIVSYYESKYDSGSWLQHAESVDAKWASIGDGQRFKFCPECGSSLAAFWGSVDASREAHQREIEREEEREAAEAECEARYSDTPPT